MKTQATALVMVASKSLASRRHRLSHANVLRQLIDAASTKSSNDPIPRKADDRHGVLLASLGAYYGGNNGMFASIPAPMIASTGEHFTSPQVAGALNCR